MGLFRYLALLVISVALAGSQDVGRLELQPSQSQRVEEEGRGFVVTCRIPDNLRGSNLRWTHGSTGKPINEANGRIQMMRRAKAVMLIFNNVTKQDEGLYTCLASFNDTNQDVSKGFQLSVYKGINFDSVRFTQTANVGSDYVLTCNVQGSPAPSINWRRDSVALDGSGAETSSEKYTVLPEGLLIRNVSKADGGEYECEASQMVEDITSKFLRKPIKLVVNFAPEFANGQEPVMVYSFLGGEVNLTCSAEAEPAANYHWGYEENDNFVELTLADVIYREDHDHFSNLRRNMTDRTDFRDMLCKAENPLGHAFRKYRLIEVERPSSPRIEHHKVRGNRIEFEVHPPPDNSPLKVIGYRAQVKPGMWDTWENATSVDFGMGKFHIVDALYHGTDYDVRFAARNEVGYGEFSEVLRLRTSDVSSAQTTCFSFVTFAILLLISVLHNIGVHVK